MRERRQSLTSHDQVRAGRDLARQVQSIAMFNSATDVALYLANDGEIDPGEIVSLCFRRHKRVYAPVIQANRPDARLTFAPWRTIHPWVRNRYRIPEPNVSLRDHRRPEQLDLIFMPLVAFDAAGQRLGMGGGFYDRTLSARGHRKIFRKPRLIGIAHEFQKVEKIPADAWDVPLDGILTNERFYALDAG